MYTGTRAMVLILGHWYVNIRLAFKVGCQHKRHRFHWNNYSLYNTLSIITTCVCRSHISRLLKKYRTYDNFLFSESPLHAPKYEPKIIAICYHIYKISSIFHFHHSLKSHLQHENGCVNMLKIDKGTQCT